MPVAVELVFPPHPDEPATTRTLSLQNLWWELTGTTPAARWWETTITLGAATFATAFVRPQVV